MTNNDKLPELAREAGKSVKSEADFAEWSMPIRNWRSALNRFTIEFEDRLAGYAQLNCSYTEMGAVFNTTVQVLNGVVHVDIR